jgi:AbrB family looped-hinge helix DNA binding protein
LLDASQKSRNTDLMKSTVTVTSRGVVTLPLGLRKALGIKADDTLIAETTPDGLLLRPAVTLPVEIYSDERIREFDESEEELAAAIRRPPATKSARRKRGA